MNDGVAAGMEVVMAEKPDVGKFTDVGSYSPAARHFDKYGFYTSHPRGTQGYYDYWDEEKKRSLYGYTPPGTGIGITGFHYFYLNFCRMQKVANGVQPDGSTLAVRTTSWPDFYDTDFFYFHYLDQCRRKDRHMIVLKSRRKGFSYKAAAMMCRNYFLVKHSKNFVFAGLKEYLTGVDAILTKAWEIMSFVDDTTAWTQPKLLDRPMEKTSGYKKKVKGSFVEKGSLSSIAGVSLKDDPDKVRGKAGELIFFEEAGAFPGLLDAWEVAMPTMRQGNKTLGTMVAFGTGGTEGVGFESLEEMYYNPAAYECIAFENTWSEANFGSVSGYFCPIYEILDGFIDGNGNSDIEAARAFEMKMREVKRKGNNPKNYDKYLAEHPFTPEEATLQVSGNTFNQALIKEQLDRVKVHGLDAKMGMTGKLSRSPEGEIKFKMDPDLRPVTQFPHRATDDVTGCVVVYESPYRPEGQVPNFLYYICHDPYGQDRSQTSSLGAAYVMKAVNNVSQPDDIIVASYVGRPHSQDEYNQNLFMLAQYYNAKIGFENDRGNIVGYARGKRKLHMLQPEFEMLHTKELQSKKVNRGYGMHMTPQRKLQGEVYLRDWMELARGKKADGTSTLNISKIYDRALLTEMLKFTQDGNFDRVMALFVGMYHAQELVHTKPTDPNDDMASNDWFENIYNGQPEQGYPTDVVPLEEPEDISDL